MKGHPTCKGDKISRGGEASEVDICAMSPGPVYVWDGDWALRGKDNEIHATVGGALYTISYGRTAVGLSDSSSSRFRKVEPTLLPISALHEFV